MHKLVTILLCLAITAPGCKKNKAIGDDMYITFSYKQSYCADPWQTGANDNATIANVTAYLKASGLYVASMQIKLEGEPQACLACQCKTGKTIYVSTLNNDSMKTKYLALGFR